MTKDEALKLALAVLKEWRKGFPDDWTDFDSEAVIAIKEALAQPEQETVALIKECRDAFAEELSQWDIDPPIHHVKQGHENCVKWLAAHGIKE